MIPGGPLFRYPLQYAKHKFVDNLAKIVEDLRHIEEGKLEAISSNTGILEFEEVTFYANKLLQSLRLNLKEIAGIIEKGKMPVGLFVDNHFYKRYLINDRLLSILGVDGTKGTAALRDVIIERLKEAEDGLVDSKEDVYFYNRNGTRIYLRLKKESDELGLQVVAEGVETQEQLDFLKTTTCDLIQGYVCFKPMPVGEFVQKAFIEDVVCAI